MRNLLLTLRSALLLLLLLGTAALAQAHDFEVDGIYYNITGDNTVAVTFQGTSYSSYSNEYTGTVTIPSTVTYSDTTYAVTSIGEAAFYVCTGLTEVTIPDAVTSIGGYAFLDCTGLKTVYFNAENCCDFSDMSYPFKNCPVERMVIGDNVKTIPAYFACNLNGLTEVTIPAAVTSIGDCAFSGCTGLTEMTIPAAVTSIGYSLFYGCNGLKTIYFNAENCGDFSLMDYQFYNCPVERIVIGDNVKTIPAYFAHSLTGLTEVTIGRSVTSIGDYAFEDCLGLTEVTIGSSVTSIGNCAFEYCTGLTAVTIPDAVTSIGYAAFSGCTGLTEVTIGRSVTSIGDYAFFDCTGLKTVYFNAENCGDFSDMSYNMSYPFYNSAVERIVVGDNVKTIPAYFACNLNGLTEVTIGRSVTSIGDCAFEDCSGLTEVTIGSSVTSIGDCAFSGCTGLTEVTIPAAVTSIGGSAFQGCTGLKTVICLALEPPTLGSYVFYGVPSDMIVYVPAVSLEAYQAARGWSQLHLEPFAGGLFALSVNFPAGTNMYDYTAMRLKLAEINSGKVMPCTVTSNTSYRFAGLEDNTTWTVALTNRWGDVLGRIDSIPICGKDTTVTFESLLKPHTVTMTVKVGFGIDITQRCVISWMDDHSQLLLKGDAIASLPTGKQLRYTITLPEDLAKFYYAPANVAYTVKEGMNDITCLLTARAHWNKSARVTDAVTGRSIPRAHVSAVQDYGYGFTNTLTTTTDSLGKYSMDLAGVPTLLIVGAEGYITRTLELSSDGSDITLPDVALQPITGVVVNVDLTYTPARYPWDAAVTYPGYADAMNVDYQVYNKTRNRDVTHVAVQYPQLVLIEGSADGDVLEITAVSRKDAFFPVAATATVEDMKAAVTLNIVEKGKIAATFLRNANPVVVGMLYGSDGCLLRTGIYSNASLTFDDLDNGNYWLLTMGQSHIFNTVYNLAAMSATGLVEGEDFVLTAVNVVNGIITPVTISEVPYLDEDIFTDENTSFSVNKSSIVIGNFLAFRAQIGFKEQYADKVKYVELIVDLPESCQFCENSVLVGPYMGGYIIDGNRLTIPMANYGDIVRFCAVPTEPGDFAPSAFVRFQLNGKTLTQPIGSAPFTAKALSINVPKSTGNPEILVSGTAGGVCGINIYDNDVLIGHTTSLADGTWLTKCELFQPLSPSVHTIHAVVETMTGLFLNTEAKDVMYLEEAPMIDKIDMIYQKGTYRFDYVNGTALPSSYSFNPSVHGFTFVATLQGMTESVRNLKFRILDTQWNVTTLNGSYDAANLRWVCSANFANLNALPTSVGLSYDFTWGDEAYSYETAFIDHTNGVTPNIIPCIDPAGFVYEGVPSNRLQGVAAACYYKDNETGEAVLWDAEQYGQENPLLTDENGYYRWDVPIGMWQVKYEKEGYETTYSDWLPVPPPQLDVNIGMVQMRQPEVIKAHAYPQAVELEFDKYMFPETLTTDNITVSVNGAAVSGSIELLNAEVDDPLAITTVRRALGTGLTFASRVRFNADRPFNASQVTLHVKQDVKSYADLMMNEDYEAVLPIEMEMQGIQADSTITIQYGDSRELTVTVVPASASQGKTLAVRSIAPMIAATDAETNPLDSNGQATITLHGNLPGMTSLLYTIDGYDLTAATLVNVLMESQMTVAAPTVSIASGSMVEKGTAVYLNCATEGATIYYTLDGSSPCDPSPARKVYNGSPIIINSNVTIQAMATAPNLYDSEVATFVYRVGTGMRGDVNKDGEVNIADVNIAIGIILGKAVDQGTWNRADVNEDDEVNIADINEIIKIILNTTVNLKVNSDDLLHAGDLVMAPGDVRTLPVALDHAASYHAMQCDITMPEGLTLVGVSAANGGVTKMDAIAASTSRAMTYSMNQRQLAQDGQTVLTLTVRADGALSSDSHIMLHNVVLADGASRAWRVPDCQARVINATGVDDLMAGDSRVWVEGRTLCVRSSHDGTARLVTVGGTTRDLAHIAGVSRHEVEPGIYVVLLDGVSHKVIVK